MTGDLHADIDLTDLDTFGDRMPHDWFEALRREAPVWRHGPTETEPEPFWVISTHELVTAAHRMGPVLSHQTGPGRNGAGGVMLQDLDAGPGLLMLLTDPPAHTVYRKLVNRGFTPRMVLRLEDALRIRSQVILDELVGSATCDFVTDIAAYLPLQAIADIVGVPEDDRHLLLEWTNQGVARTDPAYAEEGDRSMEMIAYSRELAERKRSAPADDLWTRITGATVEMGDGRVEELSELEQDMFFALLIVAGNETTRNAMTFAMQAFLDQPEEWNRLRDDRTLLPLAVEEMLRFSTPVNYIRRTAQRDLEIGGASIAGGEKVSLWYASANRDESVFADPHRFDVSRDPNPHVTFGAGGPHYCLGANLAKLELRVMFDALLDRVEDVAAIAPPVRVRDNINNAATSYPIRLRVR